LSYVSSKRCTRGTAADYSYVWFFLYALPTLRAFPDNAAR